MKWQSAICRLQNKRYYFADLPKTNIIELRKERTDMVMNTDTYPDTDMDTDSTLRTLQSAVRICTPGRTTLRLRNLLLSVCALKQCALNWQLFVVAPWSHLYVFIAPALRGAACTDGDLRKTSPNAISIRMARIIARCEADVRKTMNKPDAQQSRIRLSV